MFWLNGAVHHEAEKISVEERALLLGEGVFETILAVDGRLEFWQSHIERLQAAMQFFDLQIDFTTQDFYRAAQDLIAQSTEARMIIRITIMGGAGGRGLSPAIKSQLPPQPQCLIQAAPAPPPPHALSLAYSDIIRPATNPSSRYKTVSYIDNIAARKQAAQQGADEAIICNEQGQIACGAACNIFVFHQAAYHTPPLSEAALAGIIRQNLLPYVAQTPISPLMLEEAEHIFTSNSVQGLVPVTKLTLRDGRELKKTPPDLAAFQDILDKAKA